MIVDVGIARFVPPLAFRTPKACPDTRAIPHASRCGADLSHGRVIAARPPSLTSQLRRPGRILWRRKALRARTRARDRAPRAHHVLAFGPRPSVETAGLLKTITDRNWISFRRFRFDPFNPAPVLTPGAAATK